MFPYFASSRIQWKRTMIIPYTIATSSKDICWKSVSIITARKRSLGQDNVFTRVCHSVHGGGLPGGICLQMGGCLREGLPRGGGSASRGNGQTPQPEKWAVRMLLECFLVLHFSVESVARNAAKEHRRSQRISSIFPRNLRLLGKYFKSPWSSLVLLISAQNS